MGKHAKHGKEKRLLGQGKELVGILTGNSAMELEGFRQEAEGEAEEKRGKARRESGGHAVTAARTTKK